MIKCVRLVVLGIIWIRSFKLRYITKHRNCVILLKGLYKIKKIKRTTNVYYLMKKHFVFISQTLNLKKDPIIYALFTVFICKIN